MLELFSSETTIVVGLDLSEEEDKLIRSVVSLAKRTGSSLVFVHAAQPFRSYAPLGEDLVLPYDAFEEESYHSHSEEAQQRLYALRDRLPAELVIDIEVLRDYPENALESVAEKVGASLIVAGMRSRNDDASIYEGMSTALSLMGSSKFPVMILPLGTEIDFSSHQHRVLVADNLKEEGLLALSAALAFCRSLNIKNLAHLHVRKTSYRDINSTVEKIKLAMIEGRVPVNPEFEREVYLKQIKDEVKNLLKLRFENSDPEFAKGIHWTPRVRFGHPARELHEATRDAGADILIFGKHHFLRPKGLVFGKIPYAAMIEENVASIVVPSLALNRDQSDAMEKIRPQLENLDEMHS